MKDFREALSALAFVTLLGGAYFVLFIHFPDLMEGTVSTVNSIPGALYVTLAVLIAFGAGVGLHVMKASYGQVRWSSIGGMVLGVVFLVLALVFATVARVEGVDSGEGMCAVIAWGLAVFAGIALTSTCSLLLVDRVRNALQNKSGIALG